MSIDQDRVKKLVSNLFRYIKEIKNRLGDPVLNESKHDWIFNLEVLPDHPYVSRTVTNNEYFLKVKRPKSVECPTPPKEIIDWIKPSWKYIDKELNYLKSKNIKNENGESETIFIEDYPEILKKISEWKKIRNEWRIAEQPSEEVRKIFFHLYEARAKIEKDANNNQLYLTEGVLAWDREDCLVKHPLIYKEVGLRLVADKLEPEILVTKSDTDSSIFLTILRALKISGSVLNSLKEEFKNLDLDPDNDKIDLFLQNLVHRLWKNGRFSEEKPTEYKDPTIFLEPKLLIREKESSFAEQIDNYIDKINDINELPVAYKNIIGSFEVEDKSRNILPMDQLKKSKSNRNYFLTKPYNIEQKKIIKLLDQYGCVSVQGPPGTGKSHTIANLLGHLLAKGESVLVSSHRSKALEVIRDQVVENIRPLCVSILDDQKNNMDQLKRAVSFLDELTTSKDLSIIINEVIELKEKRNILIKKISSFKQRFLNCIQNEYKSIAVRGESILPKEAAQYINKNLAFLKFEGPFYSDVSPLSEQTLIEIKAFLRSVDSQSQALIQIGIPACEDLIHPEDLIFCIEEVGNYFNLKKRVSEKESDIFEKLDDMKFKELKDIAERLRSFFEDKTENYLKAMLDVMLRGDDHVKIFKKFVERSIKSIREIKKLSPLVFEYAPSLESNYDLDSLIRHAEKIYNTANPSVKFSLFTGFFNQEMKIIKEQARVQNREIKTKEEALSLVNLLKIKKERNSLKTEWDNLIASRLNAIKSSNFNNNIEEEISYRINNINAILDIKHKIDDLKSRLNDLSLPITKEYYNKIKFKINSSYPEFDTHMKIVIDLVKNRLKLAIGRKRYNKIMENRASSLNTLKKLREKSNFYKNMYLNLLNLKDSDIESYTRFYNRLKDLNLKKMEYEKFKNIIKKIHSIAPTLAIFLIKRKIDDIILKINNNNLSKIWDVSFLNWTLEKRNSIDPMKIQDEKLKAENELKILDSVLVKKLSIKNQLERITPQQKQALKGFIIAQRKMTKTGHGIRDAALRKESKEQMKRCKGAVPVWIMPLSKVMDNFVIGEDTFDVLIIDEASQADITNLPIFSIAKKIIVVGDDKQVSPAAAGVNLSGCDELINEFLEGIPNKQIYDYKTSLYDIACSSFGETIRLSEHFRCTPEIIQFCNDLQYQGEIKVLRESKSNPTPPSLIPFYVEGTMDSSKRNYKEAIQIASIIAAMTESEKYKSSTIGVISLSGQRQHQLIDRFLRLILSTATYEKHKIICGKAPQFQGDERNVIFLSMVESPDLEGPLRLKSATDAIRKEYNVSVSRAKDQLWIMHSMNMSTHLQSEDIRLRLLKHAKDPRSLVEKYSQALSQAGSPFEESVQKDLLRENYKIQPQYEAGAYRIDIVLFTSDGKRIALECDGDKYHSTEEQIKNDVERQSVLERLGFIFYRIRGSDYYRKREETVNSLYNRLNELKAIKNSDENINVEKEVESLDQNLLSLAEKYRLKIEANLDEGETEEFIDIPFSQRRAG